MSRTERAERPVLRPQLVSRVRVEGDHGDAVAEQHRAVAVDLLDRALAPETQRAGCRVIDLEVRLVTDHDDVGIGVEDR